MSEIASSSPKTGFVEFRPPEPRRMPWRLVGEVAAEDVTSGSIVTRFLMTRRFGGVNNRFIDIGWGVGLNAPLWGASRDLPIGDSDAASGVTTRTFEERISAESFGRVAFLAYLGPFFLGGQLDLGLRFLRGDEVSRTEGATCLPGVIDEEMICRTKQIDVPGLHTGFSATIGVDLTDYLTLSAFGGLSLFGPFREIDTAGGRYGWTAGIGLSTPLGYGALRDQVPIVNP